MTKEEWIQFKIELDEVYSDFHFAYNDYTNGRNKKIRSDGERRCGYALHKIKFLVKKNADTWGLLEVPEEGYPAAIHLDDFFTMRYLEGNLANYINRLQAKIDE